MFVVHKKILEIKTLFFVCKRFSKIQALFTFSNLRKMVQIKIVYFIKTIIITKLCLLRQYQQYNQYDFPLSKTTKTVNLRDIVRDNVYSVNNNNKYLNVQLFIFQV